MAPDDPASACIALAHRLADTAAAITTRHFRAGLAVDSKADDTPVTKADRDAETAMRDLIAEAFPDHGIVGEEFGSERTDAEFVWALDPIDGTKSFINGVPLYTTIIGILRNGEPWFGLLDQPILKDRWVGGAGHATTYNDAPAKTRACAGLDRAAAYITALSILTDDQRAAAERLRPQVGMLRVGGTDCYHYGMVASGWTDIAFEALSVYEYAAMVPIIEQAGGRMTDWAGKPLAGFEPRTVIASGDPTVHDQAVAVLRDAA